MREDIEKAIKELVERSANTKSIPTASMQLTQAVLNLAQTLAILKANED